MALTKKTAAAAATTTTTTRTLEKYNNTPFFYKNHAYKNVEAQITQKIKNIVGFLLVAISISFPASDEI